MKNIYIIKRDGTKELYNPEKIHEKTLMSTAGLTGVSASEIEMNAQLYIQEGTKSFDIQKALEMSAAEKISPETPNYEYAAARLLNQRLRKEVYGQYYPLDFYSQVVKNVKAGYYDSIILEKYTEEEIKYFGSKIKYDRDDSYTYTGIQQLYSKYLIKRNGKPIETPQELNMLMNMYVFANYDKKDRKKWVTEGYRCISTHEVSHPTPIMNGLRTNFKKFVSCNVIESADHSSSIALANAFIMMMTANKAGIGINAGKIRGLGADIDNGRVVHTGLLPILKAFEKATGAFTQEGRGGSCTINYPWFHYEADLIMQLGNAKGTEDTRVRHADHAICFNRLFFERALDNKDITLFHMNEVPGLHESMGNYEEFKTLYEKYEKSVSKKHKKKMNAYEYLEKFLTERFLTGRLYYMFADNVENGPWKVNDYVTNLCCVKGDTKIYTLNGVKNIEDITTEDKVLSRNLENGTDEYKQVLASQMTSPKRQVMRITDENTGKSITCTPDHRVYTRNRGYVLAEDLKSDDVLEIL